MGLWCRTRQLHGPGPNRAGAMGWVCDRLRRQSSHTRTPGTWRLLWAQRCRRPTPRSSTPPLRLAAQKRRAPTGAAPRCLDRRSSLCPRSCLGWLVGARLCWYEILNRYQTAHSPMEGLAQMHGKARAQPRTSQAAAARPSAPRRPRWAASGGWAAGASGLTGGQGG
jgi:hypothetical protein